MMDFVEGFLLAVITMIKGAVLVALMFGPMIITAATKNGYWLFLYFATCPTTFGLVYAWEK